MIKKNNFYMLKINLSKYQKYNCFYCFYTNTKSLILKYDARTLEFFRDFNIFLQGLFSNSKNLALGGMSGLGYGHIDQNRVFSF